MQRSIQTAGWFSLSVTEWKSARRFKPEAAGASGLCQMPLAAFSVRGNRMLLCMEICKELRYNFDVERGWKIRIDKGVLKC